MHGYQRRRRKSVAEINVVPYIDVMLVLLIIFMATAPVITQGVKVDLPQAQAEMLPEDSERPLVASIDAEGRYFLDVGDSRDEAVDLLELATMVQDQLRTTPEAPVVVKGDANVRYDAVIQLMATLKAAGVPSVGLMTQPEQ
ncbi:protein TolR [Zobellella denitrificans]|jgi:biopolymer transport protein TolR|uniref:Tol-Pal system protein TolR n=1 Tax=Zobellella denitrificans TaxID=347534 RepID=A0A231N286_9GAMM|nr:protein TolR [Zobellella denitrificans]ATG73500.1 biopolymer transporter ExbD [Zobellella denitrificans]OXS16006.1 protein TolR [Zobellella denitrificans]